MEARLFVAILVRFLHDLFTVVWMGGLIVTVISYLPVLKKALGSGPQVKQVMRAFQKQQGRWVFISMLGLILTGIMMTHRVASLRQLFTFSDPYTSWLSIKHILVVVMIVIALYRVFALGRKAGDLPPQKEKRSFLLFVVNAVLAVVVLFTSAVLSIIV